MVGYRLGNTVTDSGRVCRGVCRTSGGKLERIEELTHVVKTPTGPAYSLDGGETLTPLGADTTVSMNFWGFTPALFGEIESRFPRFLEHGLEQNPQAEMLVPNLVGELLREGLHRGRHAQRRRLARHDLQGGQARRGRRHTLPHRRRGIPRAALGLRHRI